MNTGPTIPNPHRHERDLTSLTRVSLLIGFCLGLITASVGWFCLLYNFTR